MNQNLNPVLKYFVSREDRAKAEVKYQLNYLRNVLVKNLNNIEPFEKWSPVIINLCSLLADNYVTYLSLLDSQAKFNLPQHSASPISFEYFDFIGQLEEKLTQTLTVKIRKNIIIELISLYKQVTVAEPLLNSKPLSSRLIGLKHLFEVSQLDIWLTRLIDFFDQFEEAHIDTSALFQDWTIEQQQRALNFFGDSKFIGLVNAIFFYKLHPDKLCSIYSHPEKLVSLKARLGVLYSYIELIQQQIIIAAEQQGLMRNVDYLMHGDELPRGIMIEVEENFKELIFKSVKKLKISRTLKSNREQSFLLLKAIGKAYKFSFNPARFLDQVMALRQSLIADFIAIDLLQEEIVKLFCQLPTSECLGLYGYFSNNDSCYLLYTFYALAQGFKFSWLPTLHEHQLKAIKTVFMTLKIVTESLRIELKNRHIITAPYGYNVLSQEVDLGQANRDAVSHVITIYGHQFLEVNDAMEHLFRFVEEI